MADKDSLNRRPDLEILARQGIVPRTAPGLPPQWMGDYLSHPTGIVDTGSGPRDIPKASDDSAQITRQGVNSSVLGQMIDASRQRVMEAHDEAIAQAVRNVTRKFYGEPK